MIGFHYRDFVRQMTTKDNGASISLENIALGLCGEAAEVYDSLKHGSIHKPGHEALLELGDCTFYAAAFADTVGITDAGLYQPLLCEFEYRRAAAEMMATAGRLADMVKKFTWHGREINAQDAAVELSWYLGLVVCIGGQLVEPADLAAIQDANVDKLKARWKNGFGRKS